MGLLTTAIRRLGRWLSRPYPVRRLHFSGGRYTNAVDPRRPPGCNLVGFAKAELGLGQHLRNVAQGLDRAGVPFAAVDCDRTLHPRTNTSLDHRLDGSAPHRGNLLCLNSDSILHEWHDRRELFRDRYNIAYGYWELSEYPDAWLPAMNILDEVWAASSHIQRMVAAKAAVPVLLMPTVVEVEAPGNSSRAAFGLPEDRFLFLFSFDFSSTLGRKNPLAVVEAFALAFPPDRQDVGLVLKVKTNDAVAEQVRDRATVLEAVRDPRVTIVDRALERGEMLDLLAAADAYVSLHRAEGFGLGMAESMALGTPVVATAWSGNMDFTTPDSARLVPATLAPVPAGAGFGLEGDSVWAEPDLEAAVEHLRGLADDPEAAKRLGRRGQHLIRDRFSAEAVGRAYRRRLELIGLLP